LNEADAEQSLSPYTSVEAPEEAIAAVSDRLLCASECTNWSVART